MAPDIAVKNIPNLLISTTERGSQAHESLLSAYKLLDRHLAAQKVARPVVIVSDGHSSRFDIEVLRFLRAKEMHLFITPPDTTGVTQLHDQINQNLHCEYHNSKGELFSAECTVNRDGFMKKLADVWPRWANKLEIIKNAAKRVGVTMEL